MKGGFERLLELIRVIRPRFYNRLTWVVVIAGLALLSSSLLETLISAIISKEFELSAFIPNNPVIGLTLVVLGLAYHLLAHYLHEKIQSGLSDQGTAQMERQVEHDLSVHQRFQEVLEESVFRDALYFLGTDNAWTRDHRKVFSAAEYFAEFAENEYIDEDLQTSLTSLFGSIDKLTSFTETHFFPYPLGPNSRSVMYPDLNVDRAGSGAPEEMAKYEGFRQQLVRLVNDVEESYVAYRRTVKQKLQA